ncbi:hypothetical protein BDB01DRAFT_778874 [Pilobolus umbonatus]|nr:hypothetical protein BDB01DRAFT_778874 [Pilobolus umbonatus]
MVTTENKTPKEVQKEQVVDVVDVNVEKEKKKKKPIRQSVGAIVIDPETNKILMLSSRKSEGAYRLPRGDCDENESHEDAVKRVLLEEAGVEVDDVSKRVGTYTEANKKGKIVGHHWFFQVTSTKLLDSWPALDRKRVWFTIEEAVAASADRHISRLALNSCSSLQ